MPTALPSDWRAWVHDEVTRLRSQDPERYNAIMALQPRSTRAGFPRFGGATVRDPAAAPLFLHRILHEQSPQLRAALIEALPRTGGLFAEAVVELLRAESDGFVRQVAVGALRTAPREPALDGMRLGLHDPDPLVRAEAARVASRHRDGTVLAPEIVRAVEDSDLQVRIAAMRTLGALRVTAATTALTSRVDATDPAERRHALRAIVRIDRDVARSLPQLERLKNDPDAKVAELARSLSQ
jgi:hypothetical protein